MTISHEAVLRLAMEELKDDFITTKYSYPGDGPLFEAGVQWGLTIAYYRMKELLENT